MDIEPPSLLFLALIDSPFIISIVVLLILLLFSALISGAEVAFFSLTPTDLEIQSTSKASRKIKTVSLLLEKPKKLLATILVANNFLNIAIVLLFDSLGQVWFAGLNQVYFGVNIRFVVEVGVVTFLILLFGEILPKIYASRNSLSFATFMALPLKVLDVLFTPLSSPMQAITVSIQEKFGKQKSNISVGQLSQALELTDQKETTTEEQKILQGIVTFGTTDTKQVMKNRMDIFALNQDLPYHEILPLIIENGYSRIPVYKDNVDTISGILYVKDLIPHIDAKTLDWNSLIRAPYFVPENKKLDDLLNEFKKMKMHLAIVVDEYGGCEGLVTLEDIIEEIVGDISDEFDDEDLIYSKLDAYNFVFEGKTTLKDFYRVTKIEDDALFEDHKGESETIAGFVLEIAQGFPKRGAKIVFNDYVFNVEHLDKKRLRQIKVTLPQKEV